MTVVLYSSELETFLRRHDIPFEHQPQRRFIARQIAEIYIATNPYRERLLTFRQSVSWSRFQWLYSEEDFRQALTCNVHEQSPGDISYTFLLERRPSEDRQAKGCLRVKPKRKPLEHQERSGELS